MADIILVEDDNDIGRAYAHALTEEGHTVRLAENEGNLVMELARGNPELLILDVGLPGVDGLEMLRRLREDAATATVPVAILSNFTDRDMIHRALRLDAIEWVEKASTTPSLLVIQVKRWLDR
jgi:DNA-binding response OmpR family regulator